MTGDRGTFRPEPIPAAIPGSERGRFEAAPEPARPDRIRLWVYGDGGRGKPRSILLTRRDVRGLCQFLGQLAGQPEQTRPALQPQAGPRRRPCLTSTRPSRSRDPGGPGLDC